MTAATLILTTGGDPGRAGRGRGATVFAAPTDAGGYNDPRRFAALVTRYQARVHRLVAGILGPVYSADAEDATQEVFLLAYRKLDTFRGDAKISTWLYRLAYNRAIDYRRGLDRRRDDAALPDEPAPSDAATMPSAPTSPLGALLTGERGLTLRRHLDTLPPKQRTAIHLHYWLGCTVAEIAELMDAKPPTVKSHLFRGRRALAKVMAGKRP